MREYVSVLPHEFLMNSGNLKWGVKQVVRAWFTVKGVLELVASSEGVRDWVRDTSLSVLEEMSRFEGGE
ncbi:MAG: hypothetical protein GSR79_09575, partial [Desulfurococcales archaeon]|nr:hypothetical protein [Desulfurococcales archaeon]